MVGRVGRTGEERFRPNSPTAALCILRRLAEIHVLPAELSATNLPHVNIALSAGAAGRSVRLETWKTLRLAGFFILLVTKDLVIPLYTLLYTFPVPFYMSACYPGAFLIVDNVTLHAAFVEDRDAFIREADCRGRCTV